MKQIKCIDCNNEYSSKLKKCPKCGCPTKYDNKNKLLLFRILSPLIALAIMVIITIFIEFRSQSNGYNDEEDQLEIRTKYLNIREEPDLNSYSLGRVYEDEIYTILDEEDGWFEIRTNTNIRGWICGTCNSNDNVKLLYEDDDESERNSIKSKKESKNTVKKEPLERLKDTLSSKGYTTSDNKTYTLYFEIDSTFMDTLDMNKNEFSKYAKSTDPFYMTYVTVYNYKTNKIHYEMYAKVLGYEQTLVIDWDLNTEKYTWKGDFDQDYVEKELDSTLNDTYQEFYDILDSANITIDDLLQ